METGKDGKTLNKLFINILEKYRQKLFDEGNIAFKNAQQKDCLPIGNNYIINDESVIEQYNTIMELIEIYLDFPTTELTEIYDICEVKIKFRKNYLINLRICKEKANTFAKKARKYEKIFSNNLIIHFPQQVYQLLYIDKNLPNYDFKAPSIKTLDEDIYEYENRLEKYYKENGLEKIESQDKVWRCPYLHEMINYKDFPDVINEYFQSEYFLYANNLFRNGSQLLLDNKNEKEIYNIVNIENINDLIIKEDDHFLLSPLYQVTINEKSLKKKKYQIISKIAAFNNIYLPKNANLNKAIEKYFNTDEIYEYLTRKKIDKQNKKYDGEPINNEMVSLNFINKTKRLKELENNKKKIQKKLSLMIAGTSDYKAIEKEIEEVDKNIKNETKKLQSIYENLNNNDNFGGI